MKDTNLVMKEITDLQISGLIDDRNIDLLPKILESDEKIEVACSAAKHELNNFAQGLLVVTNKKLRFVKKGVMWGYDSEYHEYKSIGGVMRTSSWSNYNEIEMLTSAGRILFANIDKMQIDKFFNSLEKKVYKETNKKQKEEAYIKEENLDYVGALRIWESLENHDEAKRIRQKIMEEGKVKVTQKVVHGDEVTKTDIKDSVLNRSNIGASSDDKVTKLEKISEMKEKGLIDDDEFKQMKKEILGK